MKVIQQTSTQLTLKELPLLMGFGSALLTGLGVFSIIRALNGEEFIRPFGVIVCSSLGLVFLLNSKINTCDFNTNTGQFTVKRQGLFSTKYIQHPLSEIVDVQVESGFGSEATHSVDIVLLSGRRVSLSNVRTGDYENIQRTATLICNFLHQVSARQS